MRSIVVAAFLAGAILANGPAMAGHGHEGGGHGHLAHVGDKLSKFQGHADKLKGIGQEHIKKLQGMAYDNKRILQGAMDKHKTMLKGLASDCLPKADCPQCAAKSKKREQCNECAATECESYPVAVPSGQTATPQAARPSVQYRAPMSPQSGSPQASITPTLQSVMTGGSCGPCYPPGDGKPCYPPLAPQWIDLPCPTAATPQGQIAGSGQYHGEPPCPPTPPACCGMPSFYCPPVLYPARPAPKLAMGYKVPIMRATIIPKDAPSYQYGPSTGASGQLD